MIETNVERRLPQGASPLRIYHDKPDASIVFQFPVVLAPNLTVPLFMIAHLFALVKLLGEPPLICTLTGIEPRRQLGRRLLERKSLGGHQSEPSTKTRTIHDDNPFLDDISLCHGEGPSQS